MRNNGTYQGGCFNTDFFNVDNYDTQNTYEANYAMYGKNYAAYPFSVAKVSLAPNGTTGWVKNDSVLSFTSGKQVSEPFYFALYDMFGQLMNIENSAIGKILPN